MPAAAEILTVPANASVGTVMDRLVEEVEQAGATVFVRVDHAAGAASVGQPVDDVELLVFGNPEVGTAAIAASVQAGLMLPLRVLVYATDDGTMLAYEDPRTMFDDVGINESSEVVATIQGVLQRLTNKAAAMAID